MPVYGAAKYSAAPGGTPLARYFAAPSAFASAPSVVPSVTPNRRFAAAIASGDVGAALDSDEELHRIPVAALGNHALEAVLEQFEPVVRRAERLRFSRDGHLSVELHEQLIELLAAGDVQRAASVEFDIWHSLPAEDASDG